MNEHDFCVWLQGWIDIEKPESLSADQMKVVKEALHRSLHKTTINLGGQHSSPNLATMYGPGELERRGFGGMGRMSSMGDGGQLANLKKIHSEP